MIVLKDAYKTNNAKCIKNYNLPPFDINANLNAAKRINQQTRVVAEVVVAVLAASAAVVCCCRVLAKQTISKWRTSKTFSGKNVLCPRQTAKQLKKTPTAEGAEFSRGKGSNCN